MNMESIQPAPKSLENDAEQVQLRLDFRNDLKNLINTSNSRKLEIEEKAHFMEKYHNFYGFVDQIFDKNTGEINRQGLKKVLDEVKGWDKYDAESKKDWEKYSV